MEYSRKEATKLILEYLFETVREESEKVYMGALATNDEETTLEDLIRLAAGEEIA